MTTDSPLAPRHAPPKKSQASARGRPRGGTLFSRGALRGAVGGSHARLLRLHVAHLEVVEDLAAVVHVVGRLRHALQELLGLELARSHRGHLRGRRALDGRRRRGARATAEHGVADAVADDGARDRASHRRGHRAHHARRLGLRHLRLHRG